MPHISELLYFGQKKKNTLFLSRQLSENGPSKFFLLGWNSCDEVWLA